MSSVQAHSSRLPASESASRSIAALEPALICDPLTAYRRDLERVGDIVRFGSSDDRWLRDAMHLERLAASKTLRGRSRRSLMRESLLQPARLLRLTERIEAAGALLLAYNMVLAARRVWHKTDRYADGLGIFRQARIARTIGAVSEAIRSYSALLRHATRHRMPDLRARAWNGLGVIYGMQGHSRAAYRAFAAARRVGHASADLVSTAFHGEMATALADGDLSRATIAGMGALDAAGLPGHAEAAIMVNVASIALRAQRPRAAVRVLADALRRTRHPRVRLHIYGKMTLASATLRAAADTERWAQRLVVAATRVAAPAEVLEARCDVAEAWRVLGDTTRARRLVKSIRAQATASGLPLIVRRCDAIIDVRAFTPPPSLLNQRAQRLLRAFEEG